MPNVDNTPYNLGSHKSSLAKLRSQGALNQSASGLNNLQNSIASQATLGYDRTAAIDDPVGAANEINLALDKRGTGIPAVGLRGPLD